MNQESLAPGAVFQGRHELLSLLRESPARRARRAARRA
ncbi:uncharacterized protein SOCEGT47_037530 [Sorangium cellulosum]|uniref:Uncharacterized protein n=1 Tax=Sorangium cellulosum TaxID=56 RepID=A0A4P2Q1X9_SORCE|nr:uncharacterized protein SOCEGT47_037530 [Sorangium cellulosum]